MPDQDNPDPKLKAITAAESRRPSHCQKILELLLARRGEEVSCVELNQLSIQYSARLSELRKKGYRIISRVEHVNGQVRGHFKLDLASVAEVRARQASDQESKPPGVPASAPLTTVTDRKPPVPTQDQATLFDMTPRHRDLG